MPGRMGGKTRTMQNLYVMRVDTSLNLIFVKVCLRSQHIQPKLTKLQGNVPGPDDGRTPVYITDAVKRVQSEALRKQLKTGGDGDWVAVDANGKPREYFRSYICPSYTPLLILVSSGTDERREGCGQRRRRE